MAKGVTLPLARPEAAGYILYPGTAEAAFGRPLSFIVPPCMTSEPTKPARGNNVFLIGPMGSGKTAVGKQLARLLHLHFYDSDAEIEHRCGVDIPYIFEKEGEAGFRDREREVIDSLTQMQDVIVATGGGAVLSRVESRASRRVAAASCYLQTSVDQQLERTRHGRQRPLLYTDDPERKLRDLLTFRGPLYESIAAIVVCTDGRQVRAVADEVVQRLQELSPS